MFMRYFTAILIDLVVEPVRRVLGKVFVDSFTTSMLAPIVLQVLRS